MRKYYLIKGISPDELDKIIISKDIYDSMNSTEKIKINQMMFDKDKRKLFSRLKTKNINIIRYICGYDREYIISEIKFFKNLLLRYNKEFNDKNYLICIKIYDYLLLERLYYLMEYDKNRIIMLLCNQCLKLQRENKIFRVFDIIVKALKGDILHECCCS